MNDTNRDFHGNSYSPFYRPTHDILLTRLPESVWNVGPVERITVLGLLKHDGPRGQRVVSHIASLNRLIKPEEAGSVYCRQGSVAVKEGPLLGRGHAESLPGGHWHLPPDELLDPDAL